MEEIMIDGQFINNSFHGPDEFNEKENELTEQDIVKLNIDTDSQYVTSVSEAVSYFGGQTKEIESYNPDDTFAGTENIVGEIFSRNEKPVAKNGIYKCSVVSVKRTFGIGRSSGKPYDGVTIKASIVCDEDGYDTYKNIRVEQYFYLMPSTKYDFKTKEKVPVTKEEQVKTLKSAMLTAGFDVDYSSSIKMQASLDSLTGKTVWMNVKQQKDKETGKVKKDDNGWPLYYASIVQAPTYDPEIVSGSVEEYTAPVIDEEAPF